MSADKSGNVIGKNASMSGSGEERGTGSTGRAGSSQKNSFRLVTSFFSHIHLLSLDNDLGFIERGSLLSHRWWFICRNVPSEKRWT